MPLFRLAVPVALGVCLATPAIAATPAAPAAFGATYSGSMTLEPSGLTSEITVLDCVDQRPVALSIRDGNAVLSYTNWGGNQIHYRGHVNPDGTVKAYHRNGDASLSVLTGTLSGGQFVADLQRAQCDYEVALNPRLSRSGR